MESYGGAEGPSNPLANNKLFKSFSARLQFYLDKTTPHVTARWAGLLLLVVIYSIRVFFLQVELRPLQIVSSTAKY